MDANALPRSTTPDRPDMALAALLVGQATTAMGYGVVFVLLAEIQDRVGFPDWGLGVVAASAFLSSFLSQASLARFADRGRARLMLSGGTLSAAAGMLWFAFGTALWELVGARLLMGLGVGLFTSASRRAVVLGREGSEGHALGRLEAASIAGFLAGPPVAAVLLEIGGARAPFLTLAALLIGAAALSLRVPEPAIVAEVSQRGTLGRLWAIRRVRAGMAVGVGLYVTIGAFDAVWARFLTDRGASTGVIALTLLLFGLPMVLAMPSGGRLADRLGPHRTGPIALACGVPLILAYGLTQSLVLVSLIAVMHALIDALTTPSGLAMTTRASPPDLIAAGQGLQGAVAAAAGGLASLIAPAIYGAAGGTTMWLCVAVTVAGLAFMARHWAGEKLRD